VLAALAIAQAASAHADTVAPTEAPFSRFSVSGSVITLNRSTDGRFAGGGDAHYTPTAISRDGRFSLKSTHSPDGGCETSPDALFGNGFES
jgi:hypothetical protein